LYDELYHDNDSKKDENTSNFEKNNNFENGKTNTFVEKSENLSNPNQNNSFITNSKVETISQSNSIFSNLNQGNNAINEDNDYLNNNFSEKSTEMNNEEDVPSLLYRFKNDDDINNDDEKQETYTTDNNFLNSNSTPNYDNGVSEQLNSDNQHTRNYQDEKYNNTPYQDKFSVDNVNSYETINSNTNKDNTTFQKEPNTNNVFSSETDQTTQLKEILQNYYVNINKKILLNQINDQEILEKKEEIEETIKTLEYSDTKEIINKIYIAQEILEYLKRIKK
jgi:hypothetical protein